MTASGIVRVVTDVHFVKVCPECSVMARKTKNNPWKDKVVKKLRNLTPVELAREGWDLREKVTALEFTDGSLLYAACDPEGNGPGSLFGITSAGDTIWVSPG